MLKGFIAINIAAVIFGSAALYGKLDVSPFWIVCMRGLFASLTLLIFGMVRRQILKPGKINSVNLIVTGTVLALHWLTFFLSVQLSGVAIATLTFAAFPIFTLIIEALKNRTKLKALELISGLMIIVAVALLVKTDINSYNILWGAVCGLTSAVLFAGFGIMSKKLTNRLPTLTVSFFQNLAVTVVLLPFLPFIKRSPDEVSEWFYLMLLGIITTALMHQLYFYALKRLTASTCSGFIALEPVYAILFAALFFSESVTVNVVISGFLILFASFLLLIREKKVSEVYPVV